MGVVYKRDDTCRLETQPVKANGWVFVKCIHQVDVHFLSSLKAMFPLEAYSFTKFKVPANLTWFH